MHPLDGLPILNYGREFKSKPDTKLAWQIVTDFFETFDADGADETTWFMLSTALKSNNEEVDARKRSNMLLYYEYFRILNQAMYYLYEEEMKSAKADQ